MDSSIGRLGHEISGTYLAHEEVERNLEEALRENNHRDKNEGLAKKVFGSRLFWVAIPALGLRVAYTIKNWRYISDYISKLF